MAELQHRPRQHEAGRWQLCSCASCAVEGTPGEMCGESTAVSVADGTPGSTALCSDFAFRARESGTRSSCAGKEELPLTWAQPRLALPHWHWQSWRCHLHPSLALPQSPAAPFPGVSAWSWGGEYRILASSRGALSEARSLI